MSRLPDDSGFASTLQSAFIELCESFSCSFLFFIRVPASCFAVRNVDACVARCLAARCVMLYISLYKVYTWVLFHLLGTYFLLWSSGYGFDKTWMSEVGKSEQKSMSDNLISGF